MSDATEATVLIAGAGIGGLCLALALCEHCGLKGSEIEVYEQATAFTDSAGGAVGLYANGLRVLRDISPDLLKTVRAAGYDYLYRRWFRHDGTEVACAREDALTDEAELQSIGIRRWKLQKALFDAATAAGITVRFKMRTSGVEPRADGRVDVSFADGTTRTARVVFGADGIKSKVREAVVGDLKAEFTGVTCLMGAAKMARPVRGICFPSSATTKNHACYYPTGDAEQIFQIYFPAKTMDDAWGALTAEEGRLQCAELAERLTKDGWDDAFAAPLRQAESVIRVGIFAREVRPSPRTLNPYPRTPRLNSSPASASLLGEVTAADLAPMHSNPDCTTLTLTNTHARAWMCVCSPSTSGARRTGAFA
jgi:2-polyprenyl-6-methoxyphenol hydroxylase-like FAD-dependent oxidoreductase